MPTTLTRPTRREACTAATMRKYPDQLTNGDMLVEFASLVVEVGQYDAARSEIPHTVVVLTTAGKVMLPPSEQVEVRAPGKPVVAASFGVELRWDEGEADWSVRPDATETVAALLTGLLGDEAFSGRGHPVTVPCREHAAVAVTLTSPGRVQAWLLRPDQVETVDAALSGLLGPPDTVH